MMISGDGPFTSANTSGLDEFPDILTYDDAWKDLWSLPESEFMLGVDGSGNPVTVDLDHDTPHIMVSAGSGAGKSVIAASLATQALVKGATLGFCDVRVTSHRWAKNLPGVLAYESEIHRIGNVFASAGAEVKRRMRVIDEFPGPVSEAPVGPRIVLVVEELNSMMEELREFEKSLPPRGVYKPTRAFGDIMNMGRAAKVHIVGLGQYVDATVIPRRWRESFGHKVLIKHSKDSWNMLAWQAGYAPPAPQHKGRGYVVTGEGATMTQFLYITEEECAMLVRTLRPEAERVGVRGAVREVRRMIGQYRELRALER